MADAGGGRRGGIAPLKAAELGFAVVLAAFGAAIIVGAREMDTGWGGSGPEAGYFPFRIGILIVAAALAVMAQEAFRSGGGEALVDRAAAVNIALFAAPLVALIALVPWIGVYLAAVAYLAFAVGVIGRNSWPRTLAVALLTPGALYALFEFAFRTPLPKGPLGPLLGMV
jgi:putative tricarboxylic transport membrane protein